jgi:anti-anti-sigma regulatory factor
MLRVTTRQLGNTCTFELSGVLGGEWVPMLEAHWRATTNGRRPAAVVVVLSDVDFIDAAGERLLQVMAEAGVEFVVSGCMNRYVIDNLQPLTAAPRRES